MIGKSKNKKAISTAEYTLVIVIILMTLLSFQKYIVRGIASRFKSMGDVFSDGAQYDINETIECGYAISSASWYDTATYRPCFEECYKKCLMRVIPCPQGTFLECADCCEGFCASLHPCEEPSME